MGNSPPVNRSLESSAGQAKRREGRMSHALRSHRRVIGLLSIGAMLIAGLLLGMGGSANARGHKPHKEGKGSVSITSQDWGTAHGQTVKLFTLTNGHRMTVKITNYGGVVQSIWVPDRAGRVKNVALGFSKLSDYVNDFENQPWPASGGSGDTYFGGIIGRYANRIANHAFDLDGHHYELVGNNGTNNINTLHGGPDAYNTKVWTATTQQTAD